MFLANCILPVWMRVRKKELELDAAQSPGEPLVLETLNIVRDKRPPDVDLQGRLLHPLLGVVEELSENVKDCRLISDHLLKGDRGVLIVAGSIQEHFL